MVHFARESCPAGLYYPNLPPCKADRYDGGMRYLPRFSLKFLFLFLTAIAVLCGYFVAAKQHIADRNTLLSKTDNLVIMIPGPHEGKHLPYFWSLLGAEPVSDIGVPDEVSEEAFQRLVSEFPEAEVRREDIKSPYTKSQRGLISN